MGTTRTGAFGMLGLVLACSSAQADLSISNKPTKNMSCNAGTCTATAKGANLNVGDLTSMLAAGDTTVQTGGGAITMQVLDGFSWTSTSRLTLDANHSIGIHKPVVVAGTGAFTITTNGSGSGGDLLFFEKGKVDFWDTNGRLDVNGSSFTLIADLPSLVSAITANPKGNFALSQDYQQPITSPHALIETFHGKLEGLGHHLSNLTLNGKKSDPIGLFGTSDGMIRDIQISKTTITSQGGLMGTLVGNNQGALIGDSADASLSTTGAASIGVLAGLNSGTVVRCTSSGTAIGNSGGASSIGGLIGYNQGSVESSSSTASVSGYLNLVGGLVGETTGAIADSRASGASGDSRTGAAGGLVGIVGSSASVSLSYATGPVTSLYGPAAGLAASNSGLISNSFATGSVYAKWNQQSGYTEGGGLVGDNTGVIQNVYALGDAKADRGMVGGLLAQNLAQGSVTAAYSIGTPSVVDDNGAVIGGFIGSDMATIERGYWDMDTSGIKKPGQGAGNRKHDPGIRGLSDSELKSGLPKGFDPNIWGQSPSINNGYPYLLANPPQ
jgi:hypothetical protein